LSAKDAMTDSGGMEESRELPGKGFPASFVLFWWRNDTHFWTQNCVKWAIIGVSMRIIGGGGGLWLDELQNIGA